jgi:H+/gluconate symporter-like permease
MALIAAIIGIPMFFEIGLVLLIPVVMLAVHRSQGPAMRLGIPALAGLSVLHGFIPPHPGPLAAIAILHANVGVTLALGLLVAMPAVAIAGPLYGDDRVAPGADRRGRRGPRGDAGRRREGGLRATTRSPRTARASARSWPRCCSRSR